MTMEDENPNSSENEEDMFSELFEDSLDNQENDLGSVEEETDLVSVEQENESTESAYSDDRKSEEESYRKKEGSGLRNVSVPKPKVNRRRVLTGAALVLAGGELYTGKARNTVGAYLEEDETETDPTRENNNEELAEEETLLGENQYEWGEVKGELEDELGFDPMEQVEGDELYVDCKYRDDDVLLQFYDSIDMNEESYLGSERGFKRCPEGETQ